MLWMVHIPLPSRLENRFGYDYGPGPPIHRFPGAREDGLETQVGSQAEHCRHHSDARPGELHLCSLSENLLAPRRHSQCCKRTEEPESSGAFLLPQKKCDLTKSAQCT